jgi:hypothetical protein
MSKCGGTKFGTPFGVTDPKEFLTTTSNTGYVHVVIFYAVTPALVFRVEVTYTIKIEAESPFETLLSMYKNTPCHRIPESHSMDT